MMIDGTFRSEPELRAYIASIKEERDEVRAMLKTALEEIEPRERACIVCKHVKQLDGDNACENCVMASNFEWRNHDRAQEIINRKERLR